MLGKLFPPQNKIKQNNVSDDKELKIHCVAAQMLLRNIVFIKYKTRGLLSRFNTSDNIKRPRTYLQFKMQLEKHIFVKAIFFFLPKCHVSVSNTKCNKFSRQ